MSPFIGHPHGISAGALELLDRALGSIWHDELLRRTRAASNVGDRSDDRPKPGTPIAPTKRPVRAAPAKL